MPIYEFRCDPCDLKFEEYCRSSDPEVACPKCRGRKVARLWSTFAAHTGSPNPSTTACNGHGGCGACGCSSQGG